MKILIIGDTHAQDDLFLKILAIERGKMGSEEGSEDRSFDVLLHTGDFEGSELVYRELSGVPFYYVAGNNDFFTDAPYERVIELDSCRIFMAHGHRHNAFEGTDGILKAAAAKKAQIAVYGHSHSPVAEYRSGILILNPGSPAWPRQDGNMPSYILLELENGKVKSFEIRYFDSDPL